ncbi:MAG: LacI family DNA-binding transcriptional regulator [Chloroflexota bacterium]
MITIKDIAKEADVSHTTVSRALRGDTRIPPTTTERIVRLADEMGYVPNSIAQSLNTQRTFTIGMLVTSVADPTVSDSLAGAERVAQERDYCIFLSTSQNDPEQEIQVLETFQRRRVDGIIAFAAHIGDKNKSALKRIQVPIVLMDSQEVDSSQLTVKVDNVIGAGLAIEHLLEQGHRQIGYIGASDRPLTNAHRLSGYRQCLSKRKINVDPSWITIPEASDDIERGWRGIDQCLEAGVTAVFCHNDQIAIGVLNACYHKGISIPSSACSCCITNRDHV